MKIENGTSSILYTFNEFELNQHDAEIRKQVIDDYLEWIEDYIRFEIPNNYNFIPIEDIKKKLNEMKGGEQNV